VATTNGYFDEGYAEGVRDAVEYLADLFEGVYDTDVFENLEVTGRENHE